MPQLAAPLRTCRDITIESWSGSDCTVTWTDAAGVEQRAVVCCEVSEDDCVEYGGDSVPYEVEDYLAFPAAERASLTRRADRGDYLADRRDPDGVNSWRGGL